MKKLSFAGTLAAALFAALLAGMHFYSRSQIFHPFSYPATMEEAGFPIEEVRLEPEPGLRNLAWWHAPEPGERTILYLHGNYGNIGHYAPHVQPLVDAGHGLLMLDYRGYGGNPGRRSDEGFVQDARAALDWLEGRGLARQDIVVYGYSLGTGVAVPLAAEEDLAGLVLAAPFGSIPQLSHPALPGWLVDLVVTDRFDSLAAAPRVTEPVLIFHGSEDRTVPAHYSEPLAARLARGQRVVIEGAGHGLDLFEQGGHAATIAFIRSLN